MTWLSTVRKAFAALFVCVGTWGVTAFEDGAAAGAEWFGLVLALGSAPLVWGISNDRPSDDDGQGNLLLLIVGAVCAVLLLALFGRLDL